MAGTKLCCNTPVTSNVHEPTCVNWISPVQPSAAEQLGSFNVPSNPHPEITEAVSKVVREYGPVLKALGATEQGDVERAEALLDDLEGSEHHKTDLEVIVRHFAAERRRAFEQAKEMAAQICEKWNFVANPPNVHHMGVAIRSLRPPVAQSGSGGGK
jgi:hypothetical protein